MTIMDYAIKYIKEQNLKIETLVLINQMRIQKQICLPCELVGVRGQTKTKEFREMNEKSLVQQKFDFEQVPNPSNKTKDIWMKFIEWISQQNI